MPDIFLSYNREDQAAARRFAEAFGAAGLDVWWDAALRSGEAYDEVTERALKTAKAVVVLWSEKSVVSRWVRAEATLAERNKTLVPVMIEPCERPIMFELTQTADLSHWTGDPDDAPWQAFLADVRRFAGSRAGVPAATASPTPRNAPASAAPTERLLAVLAFDNLSGDPEMAYFSDGVSEEVQQTVARGTDLKVVGRTSSFRYRGADKAVRRVASELNATHVLDGAVRRSGPRVRISAQLIECARETTVWSDRFDGDLNDVFALQEEIAAAVAAALKVVFAPAAKSGPVDAAAYEPYMKARELIAGSFNDPNAFSTAIELLERATSLAPDFARAWAGLAWSRVGLLRYHGTDVPYAEARAKVIKAAARALELDPGSGLAQLAPALLEAVDRYAEREALFQEALSVSPNDPEVISTAGWFHAQVGRGRQALALSSRAFELDPMNLSVANGYAVSQGGAGRPEEARALWDRFLAVWPDAPALYANAIGQAGNAQDWDRIEALAALAKERGLYEHVRDVVRFCRNLRTRDARYAARFLQYARDELARTGNVLEMDYANLCKFGLADEAFELIEQASFDCVTDAEKPWRGGFSTMTIFYPTHSMELICDRRFPRLCARLGLCDYWVKTDRWPDLAVDGVTPYDFRAEARKAAAEGLARRA